MKRKGQHNAISRRLAATKNAVVAGSYKVPTGLGESNATSSTAGAQCSGAKYAASLSSEVSRRKRDRSAQQSS